MSTPELPTPTPNFIAPEKDNPLLDTFSPKQLKVFGMVVLLLVLALGYKFISKPTIKLLSPKNNQVLGVEGLDFEWQCNKSEVSFVIEVYEKDTSNLVMRQITTQQGYKPDRYQQSFFQKDHNYYWLVMSNPDIEQSYNFVSETKYFKVNNSIEPPPTTVEEVPKDQQTPTPQPSNSPNNEVIAPSRDY